MFTETLSEIYTWRISSLKCHLDDRGIVSPENYLEWREKEILELRTMCRNNSFDESELIALEKRFYQETAGWTFEILIRGTASYPHDLDSAVKVLDHCVTQGASLELINHNYKTLLEEVYSRISEKYSLVEAHHTASAEAAKKKMLEYAERK